MAAIEGYPYLLTDHPSTSAVTTAWSGTGWTQALSGLSVQGKVEQAIQPWRHTPSVPHMTLMVGDADGTDQFGKDVFRAKPDFETRLTATFEPTVRGGGTINVQNTTGLPASGAVYIGGRRYEYSSKTATTLTVGAAGAGTLAPFTTAHTDTRPWWHTAGPGPDFDRAANPKVTDSPQVNSWPGRLVAVYLHRISGGVLDTRAQAELVFAGTIAEVHDRGLFTELELTDLRVKLQDTVLHKTQFKGRLKEGIRLIAGTHITVREDGGVSPANDFTIVASGASDDWEADAGYYPLAEFYAKLNKWLASDANLNGAWNFRLVNTEGGIRSEIAVSYSTPGSNIIVVTTDQPSYFDMMGFTQNIQISSGTYTLAKFFTGQSVDSLSLQSDITPYRVKGFQARPGTHIRRATLEVENTEGTWVNTIEWLPPQLADWANGEDYGLLLIGEDVTVFAKHESDTVFSNVHRDDPFSMMLPREELKEIRAGKSLDDEGDIEVRQVIVMAGPFSEIVTRLFASIRGNAVNHPSYDSFTIGGAGIPWSLLGDTFLQSAKQLEQASGADGMLLVLEKPTKLWDVLESELALRFAWLVFGDGGYYFTSPPTPNAVTADHTLNETNKGMPSGDGAIGGAAFTTTEVTKAHLRNVIKIEYNRNLAGEYRDTLTIKDSTSIGDQGEERPVTIKARNSYSDFAGTGSSVETLAIGLAARMVPVFGKPLRMFKRSLLGTKWLDVIPGDTVNFTDDQVRDPTTGIRGISNRATTVLSRWHDFGGGGGVASGEVELLYSSEDRTYPMAPSADFTGSGSTNTVLTLEAHAHSRSSDSTDVTHFAASDAVRVVEIDPADPASPDQFVDTIASVNTGAGTVTLTNGFGSGGRPARDTSKRYRLLYGDYTSCQAAQQLKTFQADETDGLIQDTIEPNLYGESTEFVEVNSTPTTPPELHSNVMYGEGKPVSTAVARHVRVMLNNLANFKTAPSAPIYHGANITLPGTSDWTTLMMFPFPIGHSTVAAGHRRLLYVSCNMVDGGDDDAEIRITSSKYPPTGTSFTDVVFREPLSQVSFYDRDANVTVVKGLPPIPGHGVPGCTWITVEGRNAGELAGFPRFNLGPLWPQRGKYPQSSQEWQTATGASTAPTSLWHLIRNGYTEFDLVGSNDLIAANSPTGGIWDHRLGSVVYRFSDGSTEQVTAASNSVLNVTTNSVAVVWVGANDAFSAAVSSRQLMGKRDNSGKGYTLLIDSSGRYRFTVFDGTTSQSATVDLSEYVGEPMILLGVYDKAANTHKLHVWHNGAVTTASGGTAGLGSLTNTGTFVIGGADTLASEASAAWAGAMTSSAAEGLDEDHLLSLGQYIFGI